MIPVCSDHLPKLWEALKENNIQDLKKIEHELTPSEKCVACAYLLKTDGPVKNAFYDYLHKSGIKTGKAPFSRINFGMTKEVIFLGSLVTLGLGILFVALLNYQIIGGWFGKNGPANIGSIEVSYVSMGRFLTNFGFSTWAPFWYLGFPFHVFYTPLLPVFEAVLNQIFNIPLWAAYRNLTGFAYIAGPVTLVFLGWYLSRSAVTGVLAGVLYSVMPTILYFILPTGEVLGDKFSLDFYDPRRFTVLVRWGEGPHLFSLMFVPLVGVFFGLFMEKKKYVYALLAAIFLALASLSNALGLFSSLLLIGVLVFVKSAQAQKDKFKPIIYGALVSVLTLGLISFWFNLKFISTFFKEGGGSANLLMSVFPWGWILGGVFIVVLYILIGKFLKNFGWVSSLLWMSIFFVVVYFYYFSAGPDEPYNRIEILPQALRYSTELDLSLSLFLAVTLKLVFTFLGRFTKFFWLAGSGAMVFIIILLYLYIQPFFSTSVKASSELVDLELKSVYKVSSWLNQNVDKEKGERVFVPGNYSFYLNYFTDVWQLRGALFQASTNFWPDHIYYQLANGEDKAVSDAWLRIVNAKYVLVTTLASEELYKEIKYPARFESFKKAYEENGDIIYEVPLVKPSLAKPVNLGAIYGLKRPEKADDKENLLFYADWLENSSKNFLDFQVIDSNNYLIKGKIDEGEGILVAMTSDSGWRAYDQSRSKFIKKGSDLMGYLILYPESGNVDIKLSHGTSWQEWLGYLLTVLTILGIIGYIIRRLRY